MLFFHGRHSIRKTLTQLLLITGAFSMIIATAGFTINDWVSLKASLYDRLHTESNIVGSNSVASLTFNDKLTASLTLQSLKHEADIQAAILYDAHNQTFASYQKAQFSLPKAMPTSPQGIIDGNFFLLNPIIFQEKTIGHILVIAELKYWNNRQIALLITAFGLFIVTLILVFGISNRLQRIVTDPIVNLAATARKVTQSEDYTLRADKLSLDEIGWLVDDFNEMLNQIQFRDHKLKRILGKLEDMVSDRTRELTALTHQLEHQAYHDALTGLANRTTFDDHLRLAIHQAERYGGNVTVLFLDLDRFKVINDTLGHIVGDKLLVQVAKRFAECVDSSDTLARLGGDEFAVLLLQPKGSQHTADVTQQFLDSINQPFLIDGYNLHVSTSIGISQYPNDGNNAETILKNADTAMYRSKAQGKNQFCFFAPEMNARAVRRLTMETKLRKAIKDKVFTIHYQPRRDTESLRLIGVEALIRWHDDDLGEIPPSEFIPLAAECGLTADIDDWVLNKACLDVLAWFDGKEPTLSLSVNFSATQFIRKDLPSLIASTLQKTGFPSHCLELEITENLFGPDTTDVLSLLKEIRSLGVEISIDDFGKAYSSLTRLKQLPLQTLKIDQAFVQDLGDNPDDQTLVVTIITMAKSLGLKVVAEGIETESQYQFIKRHNCDSIQGFLFGRPVPAAEFREKFLLSPLQR